MIINLNFSLDAWIKKLSLEAQSEEDAINKLMGMTLAEIMEEATEISSDFKVSNVDTEVAEYDLDVQVTEVEYDLDPEIMDISVIEYLKNFLPKEFKLTLHGVADEDEIEDMIKDEIFSETNYDVVSLKFQVLEKK